MKGFNRDILKCKQTHLFTKKSKPQDLLLPYNTSMSYCIALKPSLKLELTDILDARCNFKSSANKTNFCNFVYYSNICNIMANVIYKNQGKDWTNNRTLKNSTMCIN